MLVVANLANTKWCKHPYKWLKPWNMRSPLRVLSKSFLMSTNITEFRYSFQKIVHPCSLDKSSLSNLHWKGSYYYFLWRDVSQKYMSCLDQKAKDKRFNPSATLGSGQQPYCPEANRQQVLPSGHVPFPSGHKTAELVFSSLTGMAAVLVNHVILTLLSPRSHFPAAELHVVPSGQQWRWSLQHTACKGFEKAFKIQNNNMIIFW